MKSFLLANHNGKRLIGACLAIIAVVFSLVVAPPEGLTHEGVVSLGVLVAAVLLWVFETTSLGVAGLLCVVLLFVCGAVDSFPQAFYGFTTLNTWFVFSIFCMTAILQKSSLGARLARKIISLSGASSKRLVLAFIIVSAIVSTVMTDAGAAVVSMGLAIAVLEALRAEKGVSNLGKCLLIGVTFGAALGGFATPVSHALNIVNSGLYQQATGLPISFVDWMVVGVPVIVIMIPITWFFLVKAFPPEAIDVDVVSRAVDDAIQVNTWDSTDTKALVFLIALPIMWVVGSFFPMLDPSVVTIIGLALMFMPGINLLDWDYFVKCVNWDIFLMLGSLMSLGNAVSSTGASVFISDAFLNSGITLINPVIAMLIVGAVLYLLNTVLPIAPAICTLFLPFLIPYATAVGMSPMVPVLIASALLAGNFFLPINPNSVMTYGTGYYSFTDMAKGGWIAGVLHVFVITFASLLITGYFF